MQALHLHYAFYPSAYRNKARHVGMRSPQTAVRRSIVCDSSPYAFLAVVYDDPITSLSVNPAAMYHSLPSTSAPSKRPFRAPGTYIASSSTAYNPMQAKTAYHDGSLSCVLLTILCWALGQQMRGEGQAVWLPWLCGYNDFVRVAKAILQQGRTPEQQEQLIRRALNNSIPGGSGT